MDKKERYRKLFMDIAERSAEMSFCKRAKVGAVIVKDNRVLVNSWNGTPSGMGNQCEEGVEHILSKCCNAKVYDVSNKLYCSNCQSEIGFIDRTKSLQRWVGDFYIKKELKTDHNKVIHAEANAILFAAKNGIATNGCEMYVTLSPCSECAKMIVQAGIKKLYYKEEYKNTIGLDFLKKQGVKIERV